MTRPNTPAETAPERGVGRLDHGILNVSLAKRGNIDAQIDQWRAQQRRESDAHHRVIFHSVRQKKARVVQLLADLSDDRVLALAAPLGKRKASTARAALVSAASSNFDRWIAVLEREAA